MPMRFRRRIKIAPGIYINVGKKGSSLSIGPKGAKLTVGGQRGTQATIGIPGTGISYTQRVTSAKPKQSVLQRENLIKTVPGLHVYSHDDQANHEHPTRPISFSFAIGLVLAPYVFAWELLRQGYGTQERFLGIGWMVFMIIYIAWAAHS